MAMVDCDGRTRVGIPDPNGGTLSPTDDLQPVGCECDARNRPIMAVVQGGLGPGLDIPDPRGVITRAADNAPPVGGEGETIDRSVMADKFGDRRKVNKYTPTRFVV